MKTSSEYRREFRKFLQRHRPNYRPPENTINNAKVGDGDKPCLGKFSYGARKERGQDLINYCLLQDLKISNSYFNKKNYLQNSHGEVQTMKC